MGERTKAGKERCTKVMNAAMNSLAAAKEKEEVQRLVETHALTEERAAVYLGIGKKVLQRLRMNGYGPSYVKVNPSPNKVIVRYSTQECDRWLSSMLLSGLAYRNGRSGRVKFRCGVSVTDCTPKGAQHDEEESTHEENISMTQPVTFTSNDRVAGPEPTFNFAKALTIHEGGAKKSASGQTQKAVERAGTPRKALIIKNIADLLNLKDYSDEEVLLSVLDVIVREKLYREMIQEAFGINIHVRTPHEILK